MSFFNSLSIRIPLAMIGGVLYGLLAYYITVIMSFSAGLAISLGAFVFFFYLGSRLLILFSGIDSPYYSRGGKALSKQFDEKTSFYQTTQWVGRFFHYHDIALFIFLTVLSIVFLITLILDGANHRPMGTTIQDLWNTFIPIRGENFIDISPPLLNISQQVDK